MCQKTKVFVLAKTSGFQGPGPGLDFGGGGAMQASHNWVRWESNPMRVRQATARVSGKSCQSHG